MSNTSANYLHQCLGIVSGPLFESAALWKAAQSMKRRYRGNPVVMIVLVMIYTVRLTKLSYLLSMSSKILLASPAECVRVI